MSEEVLELSVEGTNKLRAELGLKPLNVSTPPPPTDGGGARDGGVDDEDEALELSVDDTNKLREKLGLPPLRVGGGSTTRREVHQPAENTGERDAAAERIRRAKLEREVEQGAAQVFGVETLASPDDGGRQKTNGEESALSWAAKMRQQQSKQEALANVKKTKKARSRPLNDPDDDGNQDGYYGSQDLDGMQVAHSMSELEAGSSTVLTLADAPILETKTSVSSKVVGLNEEEDALENVNLMEKEKQQDGLRKKRMLEMGMGRAGGYAGFDDEEFEELGGTLGPSRRDRGDAKHTTYEDDEGEGHPGKGRGFRLGLNNGANDDAAQSDFDKVQKGKAISLFGKADVAASDYLTIEEEEEEREKRHKKKNDTKFKKKKKKDKKRKRRTEADDGDDDDDDEELAPSSGLLSRPTASLLSQLEQTAELDEPSGLRRRRREDNADVGGSEEPRAKRAKFDEIMEKGNERTRLAFNRTVETKLQDQPVMDDDLDDSFLNAALAKARRLNRLREMNKKSSTGADTVAEAVKSSALVNSAIAEPSSGTLSFSIDDTREFTRAIRARTQQKERESQKIQAKITPPDRVASGSNPANHPKASESINEKRELPVKVEDVEIEETEDVEMEELAKEVVPDDIEDGTDYGSTAESAGVGRGLSSFVSMLKTTGEITGKHGGKEELRGRAKDERNYDNYEPLDLSKVVSIGRNAPEKDKQFANREIKLEYRDKHGRLLTQKEAFRDLCYQFHGHGASKRKEEKRLKQISREQAEARLASSQVSAARDGTTAGTLGALKATQKATGKAFIVHKT